MKRIIIFMSIFSLMAVGCGGPSEEDLKATEAKIAADIFSTQTAAVPTNTPITPSPTPVPETATFTPEPTNTLIPTVTQAPLPESGDLLYETDFSDFQQNWWMVTRDDENTYDVVPRSSGLYVELPDSNDWFYAYTLVEYGESDVVIEANVELVGGTNYTYIVLFCRSSTAGEYAFSLDTGGFWLISKLDFDAGKLEVLDRGGSTAIKAAKAENSVAVLCQGDNLSFMINGEIVGSVQDSQFDSGEVGIGVETYDVAHTEVMFKNLRVYLP